jgi:hypothetical protein
VFFGREAEVRELLDRLNLPQGNFILVSGDAGSGKSSLVDAGLLPRLSAQGLTGGRCVKIFRMLPSQGNDPYDALLRALHSEAAHTGLDPYRVARDLMSGKGQLCSIIERIVRDTFFDPASLPYCFKGMGSLPGSGVID